MLRCEIRLGFLVCDLLGDDDVCTSGPVLNDTLFSYSKWSSVSSSSSSVLLLPVQDSERVLNERLRRALRNELVDRKCRDDFECDLARSSVEQLDRLWLSPKLLDEESS